MADDAAQQDRTEAPTQRRLQRAREEGDVPISRELQSFATLAAATLVLVWPAHAAVSAMATRLATLLSGASTVALAGPLGLRLAWDAAFHGAAPFVLAAAVAGIAATALQTGLALRPSALTGDLSRISPSTGLRRLFGRDNAVETVKSIAKIAVISVALWQVLHRDLHMLLLAPRWAPQTLLAQTISTVLHMLFVMLALQAALAILDLLWVRLRHVQQLRMSRYELREEQRETEGDPKIKARVKQIRVHRARKRMLAAVPRATVVVTNPTHYAVALFYDRAKHPAPKVVAKGVDTLAARIREVAQANRIPLVANPPLAQALYRVELDTEIPAEHYQAVAEVIAYVWRLGHRQRATSGLPDGTGLPGPAR